MKNIVLCVAVLVLSFSVCAQKVNRNPEKTVKSYNQSKGLNEKGLKESSLAPSGSEKPIITTDSGKLRVGLSFTDIEPKQFINTQSEANRRPLTDFQWTKEELTAYIQGLEERRTSNTTRSMDHQTALSNGWYTFIDSVLLEAKNLLKTF
jgi:hypothetical protein